MFVNRIRAVLAIGALLGGLFVTAAATAAAFATASPAVADAAVSVRSAGADDDIPCCLRL